MAINKLLPLESVPGLSRWVNTDDPLFRGYLERMARTTEQQSRLLRQVPTGTAHPQAPASGLIVNGASLTNIGVAADELWVKDADGNPEVIVATNTIVSFNNVLDVGSIAASTWYYLWLIYNGDGAATRILISLSSTAPTMPAGYTHKGLLTALRIDAGSALESFFTIGRRTEVENVVVLTNGAATVATAVSIATAAPPIGRFASGYMQVNDSAGGGSFLFVSVDGLRGLQLVQPNVGSAADEGGTWRCAYTGSQIVYFGGAATNRSTITVNGWEF